MNADARCHGPAGYANVPLASALADRDRYGATRPRSLAEALRSQRLADRGRYGPVVHGRRMRRPCTTGPYLPLSANRWERRASARDLGRVAPYRSRSANAEARGTLA